MNRVDHEKINAAVRECLRTCYVAPSVPAAIADFCDILRQQGGGGWSEAELHEVDAGVRILLYGILHGATYPRDATNKPLSECRTEDSKSAKVSRA